MPRRRAWSARTASKVPALPFPEINPIAFELGPLVVRWYGLAYLFGVALGVFYGMALLSRPSLWVDNTPPFKPGEWLDFAFWAIFAIVIGGRLGYVLFYDLPYYLQNPLGHRPDLGRRHVASMAASSG